MGIQLQQVSLYTCQPGTDGHLEQIITLAPSCANRSAMARPMPAVAAVTTATLPVNLFGTSIVGCGTSLSVCLLLQYFSLFHNWTDVSAMPVIPTY